MKPLLTFLILCLAAAPMWAQTWKQDRPIKGISALQARAGVDVYLRQGNNESLTLDVKGFDEDDVITEVRNGKLLISRRNNGLFWGYSLGSRHIKAYLTVKNLSDIEVSSGADLKGETDFKADNLAISVGSGADMELTVQARTIDVQVSGGADAKLAGSAEKLTAQVSGGADLHADRLEADICYAQASGGADAHVYGGKELYLQASGGADVTYRGPGRLMARKRSGGGDISQN